MPSGISIPLQRQAGMLAAVLFASVSATWSPAADSAATPPVITFCSYNVKNWLYMDRTWGDKPSDPKGKPQKEKDKIIAILKEIHPDVLGVCEIGTEADFADLKKHLADAGLHYEHSERAHGGDTTRTLGLLSKFPITARNSQTTLTYLIGEQTFPFQRGILDATIQVTPEFSFRALGVHLKSMREIPEADQSLMRRNEAHLLRKHIDSILKVDPTIKLMAYGDFNEHPKNPPLDEIRGSRETPETSMSDVYLKDINGEIWTHFWDWEDTYSRLDYIFVNKAFHPHVKARDSFIYSAKDFDQGSDHRPLVLKISVESTKAKKE